MKYTKILLGIVTLILLSSFASAGFDTFITFSGDTGLEITGSVPPSMEILKGGNVILHVFNKSNGVLMNSSFVSCDGHLFAPNGTQIINQNAVAFGDGFSFSVQPNSIKETGIYGYSYHCHTISGDNLGGYGTGFREFTLDGLPTNPVKNLTLIIGVGLISMILFSIGFGLNQDHFLLKLLFFMFGLSSLFVIPSGMISSMTNTATILFKLLGSLIVIFFIYFLIYIIWYQFKKSERIMGILRK